MKWLHYFFFSFKRSRKIRFFPILRFLKALPEAEFPHLLVLLHGTARKYYEAICRRLLMLSRLLLFRKKRAMCGMVSIWHCHKNTQQILIFFSLSKFQRDKHYIDNLKREIPVPQWKISKINAERIIVGSF